MMFGRGTVTLVFYECVIFKATLTDNIKSFGGCNGGDDDDKLPDNNDDNFVHSFTVQVAGY